VLGADEAILKKMTAPPDGKYKILACDDDPMILTYYETVLTARGFEVITAATGKECLETARKTRVDAILLDVNLTDTSGLDVCSILKEDPSTQSTPLLFVTAAFSDLRGRVISFEAGADDFVVKPFTPEELILRVLSLIRTRELQERGHREQQTRALLLEEKRHSERLKGANEELQSFTYAVSHDLRVPLVNIKGFVGELKEGLSLIRSSIGAVLPHLDEATSKKLAQVLDGEIPEALQFIDTSASRMDKLINAIFILSRMGRRELHPELLNMTQLVEILLKSLAHSIEERHIKVMVGLLPDLLADRTSMEMIVGNLLSNAVKYLDPSRPGEIEITGTSDPEEVTIRVRDNGRGIRESDQGKLFQLFRRLGNQDVPGEGMGLSYVRTLVRRHGGRIWCDSKEGVGSTFTFVLPRSSS